jgi:STE24 endopeptidase
MISRDWREGSREAVRVAVLAVAGCVSVAAAVVLCIVAAARARSAERSPGPDQAHDLRLLRLRMRNAGAACGAVAAVGCWLEAQPSGGLAVAITGVVAFACALIPVIMAGRPVTAAYARVRGIPARALRLSPRRALHLLIAVVVLLWPLAAALELRHEAAVAAAVVVAGCLVVNPVLLGLLTPVAAWARHARPLPPDAGQRLLALAGPAGVTVRGRMIDGTELRLANAAQAGWLPGLRYVLVTDYLLDNLSPAESDAVIAHELGHARSHDMIWAVFSACLVLALFWLFIALSVSTAAGGSWLISGVGLAAVAAIWVITWLRRSRAIRRELAADDVAVAAVGPEAVAAMLERLTELNAIKRDTSRRFDRRAGHPGMDKRIARLRAAGPAGAGIGAVSTTAKPAP